jgi:hypothetical protein
MVRLTINALLAVSLQAPPVIGPGDPALQPRCAGAVTDTFELVLSAPDQPDRLVSTLHRTRQAAVDSGRPVCVVTQRYQRAGSSDLDSSVALAATLAPVRYAAWTGAERQRFGFTADSVAGTVQVGDSAPRHTDQAAPGPYFLAVMDLEVVRALPLALGYAAQFESYNPPRGFHRTVVRVVAVDTLLQAGRQEPVWRLDYDAGAAPTVLWLRRSDHALLRSRSALPDGAVFWRRRPGAGQREGG